MTTRRSLRRDDEMVDVYEAFLEVESDLALFDWQEEGIPIWERLRFSVYREVLKNSGVFRQPHTSIEKGSSDFLKGGYLWARNILFRNPLFGEEHDVLIWGHQRRKQLDDGYWWDLYTDPLISNTDIDYQYVESDHNLKHHRPTKTETIDYLDLVTFSSTLHRGFSRSGNRLDTSTVAMIETELSEQFGVEVDIGRLAYEVLTDRRVYLPLYRRMLRRVDPKVALVVVGYGRETFIEACKREGVPVVELQHGTIDRYHMGYSFPGNREKIATPDYLFSFGSFWTEDVPLPIDESKVYPVGYQYLKQEYERYAALEESEELVFISQGTVGEQLSRVAARVERELDKDIKITYKLHPGEFDRWETEYPWLVESGMNVVADEVPLYKLLSRAQVQIGVYSTAVFEGLRFGTHTVLFNANGISHMERLVHDYDIPVVSDSSELMAVLPKLETQRVDEKAFFSENPIQNFESALNIVLQQ